MMEYMLIIIAVLIAFMGGFFIGDKFAYPVKNKAKRTENEQISNDELRLIERRKKEYENFLNYTGDEQKNIEL